LAIAPIPFVTALIISGIRSVHKDSSGCQERLIAIVDGICCVEIRSHSMTKIAAPLDSIEHWPLDEQVALAEQLRERLVTQGWVPDSSAAQLAEIERRLADAEANPDDVVTWDDVVNHVRRSV
jgi:putative addiction module component (TIGR02574 family)